VLGSSDDVLFLVKCWASWSAKKGNSNGKGGAACVLRLLLQPKEGASSAPRDGLEVDLSRGEQGESQEWEGAGIHTQPLLICCG